MIVLLFGSITATIASKLSAGVAGVAFSVITYELPAVRLTWKSTATPPWLLPLPVKIGGSIKVGAEESYGSFHSKTNASALLPVLIVCAMSCLVGSPLGLKLWKPPA